jgi:hypothetical protein
VVTTVPAIGRSLLVCQYINILPASTTSLCSSIMTKAPSVCTTMPFNPWDYTDRTLAGNLLTQLGGI